MDIHIHTLNNKRIAEVRSLPQPIASTQDALDLMGNLYYEDCDRILIHVRDLSADFFELKNGLAGDILQKFSNYRVRLAIVGDFNAYTSKSLKDFIYESNKGKHINFVSSVADALKVLE